jgi:hypothetical protein
MDAVWTNLLSGFIGAVMGGLLAIVGSIKATKDLTAHERTMEDDRELRLHRAAVRAVVVELTSNSVALAAIQQGGLSEKYAVVDTTAYDALLIPLYSLMPAETTAPLARAYSRLHIFKAKPMIIATEHQVHVDEGLNALLNYSLSTLELDLSVPDQANALPLVEKP